MTTITALDIIKRSLRLLRIYGPGRAIPEPEAADNLYVFNSMLDYFSSGGLVVVSNTTENFPITALKSTYTIGEGGDFDTPNPIAIDERASFIRYAGANDFPLLPMTEREYNSIAYKNPPSGAIPKGLWYNPKNPLADINLYPTPQAGLTLFIVSQKPFDEFADLFAPVSFPPGYRAFFEYNLAVWLSDEYKKALTPTVAGLAKQTFADIRDRNVVKVRKDLGIPVQHGGGFNFFQGE